MVLGVNTLPLVCRINCCMSARRTSIGARGRASTPVASPVRRALRFYRARCSPPAPGRARPLAQFTGRQMPQAFRSADACQCHGAQYDENVHGTVKSLGQRQVLVQAAEQAVGAQRGKPGAAGLGRAARAGRRERRRWRCHRRVQTAVRRHQAGRGRLRDDPFHGWCPRRKPPRHRPCCARSGYLVRIAREGRRG